MYMSLYIVGYQWAKINQPWVSDDGLYTVNTKTLFWRLLFYRIFNIFNLTNVFVYYRKHRYQEHTSHNTTWWRCYVVLTPIGSSPMGGKLTPTPTEKGHYWCPGLMSTPISLNGKRFNKIYRKKTQKTVVISNESVMFYVQV